MQKPTQEEIEDFTVAFIEAMFWSTTNDGGKRDGEYLDASYNREDIHPNTLKRIEGDCISFLNQGYQDITSGYAGDYEKINHAGSDFWLTREGHGAGFWDGDWTEKVGERLTALSKSFKQSNIYVGDDDLIHFM